MTDLPDRILEAIAETERIARATLTALFVGGNPDRPAGKTSGEWTAVATEWRSDEFAVVEDGFREVAIASDVNLTSEDWSGLSRADSAHITRQGPAATLRRCEADKRTVERHQLRGKSVLRNGEFVDYCAACLRVIPCPDLLDRAAAYDVEAS